MLVLQLALASQVPVTPLLLQAATIPSAALIRSTLVRRNQPQQQKRNFRFSLWSSYLDPEFQRELQRRQRIIKHKYAEAVNRKLSWDWKHPIQLHRRGFKGFVCSGWRGQDPRPGGRWVDVSELKTATEVPRPGRSIEDVEQAALEKLWDIESRVKLENAINGYSFKFRQWVIPESELGSQQSAGGPAKNKPVEPQKTPTAPNEAPATELEYDIDPISNRKVFRKSVAKESEPKSTSTSPKTFKGYRSQFSAFEPPSANAESNVVHLDGQSSSSPSHASTSSARTRDMYSLDHPTQEELDSYKTFKYNELEEENLETSEHPTKEELDKYKPFKLNEPNGKVLEESSDDHPTQQELDQYKPFKYNEPDGNYSTNSDQIARPSKDFTEVYAYEPFKYNEPDGQPPTLAPPFIEEYGDLESYKPFGYNEPDGQQPQKQAQTTERPYTNGFINSTKRSHDVYSTQFTKNRKFVRSIAETDKSEDLDLLRASDIRASSGITKGPKNQTDAEIQVARRKLEDDFDNDQLTDNVSENEAFTAQKFREDYARKLERQRIEKLRTERQKFQIELNDLKNLTTRARFLIHKKLDQLHFEYDMAPDRILLAKRNQVIERVASEFVESGELGNDIFPPHSSDEYKRGALERWIQSAVAEKENKMFRAQTAPVTQRKLTGNFVRDFPEEFATSWTIQGSTSDSLLPKIADSDAMKKDNPKQSQSETFSQYYTGNASSNRIQTSLDRGRLTDKVVLDADPYSKKPIGLEVSYAKEREQTGEGSPAVFASSYNSPAAANAVSAKPDAQGSKNMAKRRDRELVREVRDIYESKYGTIDCNHRQVSENPNLEPAVSNGADHRDFADKVRTVVKPTSQLPVPTIYKILAYDPVMQAINIAETTSIVPDMSSALTPADVLLRLSNPAKFFPHFHPLQSQGYEIVSGSGDVLVFRKVRDGAPPTPSRVNISPPSPDSPMTNPIDGMQAIRPTTGNFASPTGFVNHDLPEETEAPFKSNIDVRREEDVFSGRNSGWQESANGSSRKRWGTGKRVLVGAGTVAATSYAVGVVIEFFRTGGVDGKGPEGL